MNKRLKYCACFFTLLLLLHSCNLWFYGQYYHAQKQYLIQNKCINRFNPSSTCQAQCFLKSMVNKASSEDEDTNNVFQLSISSVYLTACYTFSFHRFRIENDSPVETFLQNKTVEYYSRIFRPPRFVQTT
jgi:hypothetical protein